MTENRTGNLWSKFVVRDSSSEFGCTECYFFNQSTLFLMGFYTMLDCFYYSQYRYFTEIPNTALGRIFRQFQISYPTGFYKNKLQNSGFKQRKILILLKDWDKYVTIFT